MTSTKRSATTKSAAKKPAKRMPVAGKSGKDGVTAEPPITDPDKSGARVPSFRYKDAPVVQAPGQFQPH
jgi:hypothetical protein